MSVANVLRLDEYRDRRQHRLSLAKAFWQNDRPRRTLFDHLRNVAEVTGSDRVAAVWIDEYGPGQAHPYLVLDLIADRPRRVFSLEPLHNAWDDGIPGSWDGPAASDSIGPSTVAVALGSDGARGWFLVADSVGRRPALEPSAAERLMFLAGECSSVVLHRDLDAVSDTASESRFAGWEYLSDLDGHEDDEARATLATRRFVVGRLVRMLIDDDLVVPDERRHELAERARRELADTDTADPTDRAILLSVLDAYESGDLEELCIALRALGDEAERLDHAGAALAAFQASFEVGAAVAESVAAVQAARAAGRVLRRRAEWARADAWYEQALAIAQAAGLGGLAARTLSGLGLIKRDLGNLPAARERFEMAIDLAGSANDSEALGSVYQDLMGLEVLAGDHHTALRHGWRAVNAYQSEVGRVRCMAGVAGVLLELGDLDPAEDAFSVVAETSREHYYRMYALDALGHIAALRGDAALFVSRAAAADAMDWEGGPLSAKAEIMYYRGLSYEALGQVAEARSWLERTIEFAGLHKFSPWLFKAEAALERLGRVERPAPSVDQPAPAEIRTGLRVMREELVGAGA